MEVGGVDPDTRDENGWTLLRTAAWSGQAHCVQVRLPEIRICNTMESSPKDFADVK